MASNPPPLSGSGSKIVTIALSAMTRTMIASTAQTMWIGRQVAVGIPIELAHGLDFLVGAGGVAGAGAAGTGGRRNCGFRIVARVRR